MLRLNYWNACWQMKRPIRPNNGVAFGGTYFALTYSDISNGSKLPLLGERSKRILMGASPSATRMRSEAR